jgi:anti-sigma-K factor RskA
VDARPTAAVVPLAPRRRVWPWQVATVASLALAAGLAAITLLPSVARRLHPGAPPPRFAALMPADSDATGFLAEARADGSVVVSALAPVAVPPGHDLELWILRPGESAPAPLGVLPPGGRRVTLGAMPPDGTRLMVSLEPPGGSPTGAPTGPVLYAGALKGRSL